MSRSPSHSFYVPLCAALAGIALMLIPISPARAQSGSFGVVIETPAEQETFYAGPTSWAYSIDVSGNVTGIAGDPTAVQLRLDVFQGASLVQTIRTAPAEDGSFAVDFTVNPEGSDPLITIDMLTRHCTSMGADNYCHYRAKYTLPRGHVVLRVTATTLAGSQATAERHIVVDRSAYATLAVKVVHADHPEQAIPGVTVVGTTWLYAWRARSVSDATGENGIAKLDKVEALAEAPTRYVFRVDPTVVNGIVYESVDSVEVVLPPGATAAPAITLKVRGRTGQINGTIDAIDPSGLRIHAIHLPDGKSYTAQTSSDGTFTIANLPVGEYLVTAEGSARAARRINLAQSSVVAVALPRVAESGNQLRGTIRDARGGTLPFGWVVVEREGLAQRTMPTLGTFTFSDVPSGSVTVVASAPGFYYQARATGGEPMLDLQLVRRPETQTLACGSGEIVVPPESQVIVEPQGIVLEYGWLWGGASDCRPQTIRVADTDIALTNARFAVEYLSEGTPWLYVFEGAASVRSNRVREPVAVRAGEMLALTDAMRLVAVPFDPIVVAALSPVPVSPIAPIWETSLEAQIRDRVAQTGIGIAQVMTGITYLIVVLTFTVAPLFIVVYWLRHQQTQEEKADE